MLSEKTLIVLEYLQDYYKYNSKPINPIDVNIDGLTLLDITIAFSELNNNGFIQHVSR